MINDTITTAEVKVKRGRKRKEKNLSEKKDEIVKEMLENGSSNLEEEDSEKKQ